MAVFSSKFVQTIKTFSEDDLKSFDQWLRSPWCNTNKNVPKLFEKLKKYYPAFDNPKLTKEKLFKQVLPNGKFSDRRMNNLLSEGYLAAERFMVFQNFSTNENLQRDLLTQELQNRHLEDWFFRDAQTEIDRLEAKPIKDWEDHLDLLRLHRRVYHHPNQTPRMQSGGQTIIKMGEQLDLVYLLEKAAIINEKIFRKRILKDENHDIESELKIWLAASEGIEYLPIKFYKMRFAYQEETMLEQYFKIRETFLEKYKELNEKEQKIHLRSLLNDSSYLINRKKLVQTQVLPLYKLGLTTGILFNQGKLTFKTYVSIIVCSNLKKDFQFTNQIIQSYTIKIDNQFQPDSLFWAKAHMAYRENKLEKCLDILLSHHFSIKFFQLFTRVLTTQVYFDLFIQNQSYQSYLFNYFDSFEKWLSRGNVDSEIKKKSHLRFVQVCRTIAKHFISVNFEEKKIQSLLTNETNIILASWLEQRIKIIIKRKTKRSPFFSDDLN